MNSSGISWLVVSLSFVLSDMMETYSLVVKCLLSPMIVWTAEIEYRSFGVNGIHVDWWGRVNFTNGFICRGDYRYFEILFCFGGIRDRWYCSFKFFFCDKNRKHFFLCFCSFSRSAFFASDRVVFVTFTNVDYAVAMEEITLLTLVAWTVRTVDAHANEQITVWYSHCIQAWYRLVIAHLRNYSKHSVNIMNKRVIYVRVNFFVGRGGRVLFLCNGYYRECGNFL